MRTRRRKGKNQRIRNQAKSRGVRTIKESAAIYKAHSGKGHASRIQTSRCRVVPLGPEDWDKYRGEIIAFVGDQILGHGHDLNQVLGQVWEQYGKKQNEVSLFIVPTARHKLL
jgi:hypothetical protein